MAWEPPRHLGYVAVKGLPVRHYHADVYLDEQPTGTVVTWRCSVEPLIPGTGALLRLGLRAMVPRLRRGVCRYADRLALNET